MEKILDFENINKLEEIQSEIETQKSYKFLGYLLIPLIFGIFIIKRTNTNISILSTEKEKLTHHVINDIEKSNNIIKNRIEKVRDVDIYLIYSYRTDLIKQLEDYKKILHGLKIKRKSFESHFNNIVETSINSLEDSIDTTTNFNRELIVRRKTEYDSLFKQSSVDLNDEQKTAIITEDKHNLVVAGAGTGKTEVLLTRVAYLVLRKQDTILQNRILVLAFQNKAAKEIKDRLYNRFNIDVKIKTFHSLGLEILNNSLVNPKLKFGDNFDANYNKFINNIFDRMKINPPFQSEIVRYMELFGDEEQIKNKIDFEEKEDFHLYMRNLTYVTLNGTKVKSEGERAIMNCLLSHKINGKDIKVLYESPAKWMEYEKDGQINTPKPDFFLPEYNIYIEHWALNEKDRVPDWFGGENPTKTYKNSMNLKKEAFKKQTQYSLIETSYGEFKQTNFIETFKKKLISEIKRKNPNSEVILSQIEYHQLVNKVWKECKKSIERLPKDVAIFIIKAKTNGLTPQNIHNRLEVEKWSPKQKAFAEIALTIYTEYEKELKQTNEIDFSDMINQAVVELKNNKSLYENLYDHILIDEYQDISTQRYEMIKVLMGKNPKCKLFCVGDDWQSIMGFTGSNLEFFLKFQKYFDHPARTDLSINYRSIKSIVDAGADLIRHNGNSQLKKKTIAKNDIEKKITVYSSNHKNQWNYYKQTAIHCVDIVQTFLKNGYNPQDIMILCRIVNKPPLINPLLKCAKENNVPILINGRNPKSIPLMSVHKSKGLQAKVVLVLSMDKDLYGFPCEIENPLIFEPAMNTKYDNKEEEERRLFYVAVTRSKENVILYTQKGKESKFLNEIKNHTEIIDL